MDGQEIEVSMESGEDGVLMAVLDEIRGGGCKEMWAVYDGMDLVSERNIYLTKGTHGYEPIFASVTEVVGFKTQTQRSHLG